MRSRSTVMTGPAASPDGIAPMEARLVEAALAEASTAR